jgi:hypothetical protein
MSNSRWLRVILLILIASTALVSVASAQGNGQFCVRVYEDLNSNGQRDAGEDLLAHSVGAELHEVSGVVVASAILDTSPTNAQGLICFQNLPAGQYTVIVTSAEYMATGLNNMTAVIGDSTLPAVFEYGGRRMGAAVQPELAQTPAPDDRTDELVRLAIAAGGGLFTMMVVAFIGFVIYLLVLRQPAPRYPEAGIPPHDRYMRPNPQPGNAPPYDDREDYQ